MNVRTLVTIRSEKYQFVWCEIGTQDPYYLANNVIMTRKSAPGVDYDLTG